MTNKHLLNSLCYAVISGNTKLINECLADSPNLDKLLITPSHSHKEKFSIFAFTYINYFDEEKYKHFHTLHNYHTKAINDLVVYNMWAVGEKDLTLFKVEKERGLKISNLKDKKGRNILHYFFAAREENSYEDTYLTRNIYQYKDIVSSKDVKFLDFFIAEGVDVNAKDNKGNTILHGDIDFDNDKQIFLKLASLKKAGFNFLAKNDEGISVFSHMIKNNIHATALNQIINDLPDKTLQIKDLAFFLDRRRKADTTFDTFHKKGFFQAYPILWDYILEKKKPAKAYWILEKLVRREDIVSMLSKESLHDFLKEAFGTSSKQMVDTFLTYYKNREYKEQIDISFIKAGIYTKDYFIPSQQYEAFFNVLKNEHFINSFDEMDEYISPIQLNHLMKLFTNKQQIELLSSLTYDRDCYDTVKMFIEHDELLTKLIKKTDFKKIKTFKLLHDVISKEATKIEQGNYPLGQEKHFPTINDLGDGQLDSFTDYKLIAAKTNHDLINWGIELHNCIGGGSYAKAAKSGDSLLFGLIQDHVVKYTIEISRGKINQIEGKHRNKPGPELYKDIIKKLKTIKVIK